MNWTIILFALGSLLLAWLGFSFLKNNPQLFSKENLGKSAYVMGWLTLLLIIVVGFCVMMLKS